MCRSDDRRKILALVSIENEWDRLHMKHWSTTLCVSMCMFAGSRAEAQGLTAPPSGGNQKASVTQGIGLVRVTIEYSSPDVIGPNGEDRRGKIWGGLVPYGFTKQSFGTCGETCPWRAGANENTVLTTTHDVMVEGEKLPAGEYGLHMVPGETEWTVIFSKDTKAWGSYFYDPEQDALRVTVEPRKTSFHEWLTYEFIDRKPDGATFALRWEELEVPVKVSVPNVNELYVAAMREELTGPVGFNATNLRQAAQFTLTNQIALDEGLKWAQTAVNSPFFGQENFNNLSTLASLQDANGLTEEARATESKALDHPTATPLSIHVYGRSLLARGENERALEVFKRNAKKHRDAWPVHVGLARGYSAVGDYERALRHAKKALAQAPDDVNRKNLERAVEDLGEGKPFS